MHCINELCYILIISISNFLIFIHFTNQKTLKPNLAQKLKLIFKFITIMGQINIPLEKLGVLPLFLNFKMNLKPILFDYISQVIAQ